MTTTQIATIGAEGRADIAAPFDASDTIRRARAYADAGQGSDATQRARASDWRHFTAWCQVSGAEPLPATPETVAAYMADSVDGAPGVGRACKPSTLRRRLATIAVAHRLAGHPSPCAHDRVRTVWKGIARTKGTAQRKAAPVMRDELRAMLEVTTDERRGPTDARSAEARRLQALRDRAILALGYAGAFRRSELVGLDVEDLGERAHGLTITVRHSKTDQAGAGEVIPVDAWRGHRSCPVATVRAWLVAAGISSGPVFRAVDNAGAVSGTRLCARVVALVVKRAAGRAGLDAAAFGGHSLRAGHVSQQFAEGAEASSVAEVTRHRSLAQLRGYDRRRDRFSTARARRLAL